MALVAAIKGLVVKVKDELLGSTDDNDNGNGKATIDGHRVALALLRLELAQRGVAVTTAGDEWDASKILDAVRSNAGKAVLETAGILPAPLLAASSVVSGRLAEALALTDPQSHSKSVLTSDKDLFSSVMERCREVNDDRFLVLMTLLPAPASTAPSTRKGPPAPPPPSAHELALEAARVSNAWLHIAEGYFLRAANFQPETPPMWKKAWDVTVLRQQLLQQLSSSTTEQVSADISPADAAFALSNMARIAASKGNAKRAAELQIRLAQAYLQQYYQQQKLPALASFTPHPLVPQKILPAFVLPYKSPSSTIPSSPTAIADQAIQTLNASRPQLEQLSSHDVLEHRILDVQALLAHQDARIEEEALHQHTLAQRRVQESAAASKPLKGKAAAGATAKPKSLEQLKTMVRRQVLAENIRDSNNSKAGISLDSCAVTLFDVYITACSEAQRGVAASVLQQVLLRYRDRAQAVSLHCFSTTKATDNNNNDPSDGWACLVDFLVPLLTHFQRQCQWLDSVDAATRIHNIQSAVDTMPSEERELWETTACLVPCCEWMLCSSQNHNTEIPSHLRHFTSDMLSVALQRTMLAKQQEQAAQSNVLKSSQEPLDLHIRTLECARAAIRARNHLASIGDHTAAPGMTRDIRIHTEQAVAMSVRTDKYQTLALEYGCSYWQALIAWSGWHEAPWGFATIRDARRIIQQAQQTLSQARTQWGRPILSMEQVMLDVARADAECGILSGGFPAQAGELYRATMLALQGTEPFRELVQSHCLMGLTGIILLLDGKERGQERPEELAQQSLDVLKDIRIDNSELTALYLWTAPNATLSFIRFHISLSRQLVADSLVRIGHNQEALACLQDAVRDSPGDADAAFALGAFRLREAFTAQEPSAQHVTAAKMQLLKAAKLDARKADPFALLGVWYEEQQDRQRALGCYSKALLLDPPNPVAGRGLLRLMDSVGAVKMIDGAINTSSPVNGWAWRALGWHKVMVQGENELGAVAFLKALRCRDIDQPQNEPMAVFYQKLSPTGITGHVSSIEKSDTWSELAFCYRRLGRYTAAIRGYYSAIEAAGGNVPASLLCACGEAELELGLIEEAAEKFTLALEMDDARTKPIAVYGQGSALYSLARRDAQDGKAGAAFSHLQRAIDGYKDSSFSHGCTWKLLGDLHSFGASLPPDVFSIPSQEDSAATLEKGVEAQIAFVQKGEGFYRLAVEHSKSISTDEEKSGSLQASLITDIGANILLQAQLMAYHKTRGLGHASAQVARDCFPEVKELYDRASAEFQSAVESSPLYAPSWCGLGCSVVLTDPLLAQHTFCRSIQLDNLAPDAYSNLAFLYTSQDVFASSEGVLDALTQVADTPMMWINRALILERRASTHIGTGSGGEAEEAMSQAADAYRAALQVVKHPSAMLGLALTSRASSAGLTMSTNPGKNPLDTAHGRVSFQESYCYLLEYLGTTGPSDASASLLEKLLLLERGVGSNDDSLEADAMSLALHKLKTIESLQKQIESDSHSCLNLDLIKRCLDAEGKKVLEEVRKKATSDPTFATSLARQIVHQPHRGDLWVDLTKELAKEVGICRTVGESARLAASRAVNILTQQLTFPNKVGSHHSFPSLTVQARDLSEALSLVFWLEHLDDQGTTKTPASEGGFAKCLELQRSLIMCPQNKMARESLKLILSKQ